jgi:cation/acetate symporter
VWGGPPGDPDTGAFTWYDLNNPGIISIPMGFLGCIVGTLLSSERSTERTFHELFVRSETGLGAEKALSRH